MNLNVFEVAILKILVKTKLDMPQYEDAWLVLNSILTKLENYEEVK